MAFQRRWLLVLSALVLGGGQVFAASTKEGSAYAAAVAAYRAEFWNRAETEFTQFLQQYPQSTNAPEAVLLQAQAEFKQGKMADAITLLAETNHLAKAGTLADQYAFWTGEAQFQNGDFSPAAETWIALAQKFPESPLRLRAVTEAAAAFERLTNWTRVDDLLGDTNGVFQRAAQLDPGNELVVDGWLSLENSKYQQRDFPGVVAVYESLTNQWQTLNQDQQCQGAYLFYRAKMELGDFAAALAATTNLVRTASSPTNQDWLATAWVSRGAALEQMDRRPEAIQAWQKISTNAPVMLQRQAIFESAELEIAQGRLTNAGEDLTHFLAQFPEAASAGIALLTAGELRLKDYTAQPRATNDLQAASAAFNQFLATTTNGPLAGKAHLDLGWCEWLANDWTNSLGLTNFEAAAHWLPPSVDRAMARFKMGDALFALTNYAGALENYRAALDGFTNFPAVAATLGDRALYQILRANLELTNLADASNALAKILKQFPSSNLAPGGVLLYGEGLADAGRPAAAREQFLDLETQFPDTPLRPQVEFDLARTYELEANWPAAIAGYQGWLKNFPTNGLWPQVDYALALANAQAGNETNAFTLFTNFVARFSTNDLAPDLAPLAQWWVADYFFDLGGTNYGDAERNYDFVYQDFPTNELAYRARLMAGRAAVARQDYSDAIRYYFSNLWADAYCPLPLRVQAGFAYGDALMSEESADTNNPLANFQLATNVFSQICELPPTNEWGALAWGKIGDCELQLTHYDAATNAYAQVVGSTNAGVSARSEAQIGIGIALEKMAALANSTNQTALVQLALDNYLDVFDTSFGKNLREGETADPFWVKEAGLKALFLIQALGTSDPGKFIDQMEKLLPQLKDSLETRRATLPPPKS